MKKMMIALALCLGTACASQKSANTPAPAPTPAAKALPTSLEEAVASPYRTEKNKERDGARHPQQTLEFFEIKPDQTVVEIAPATGWYTEILAPYVSEKGRYVGTLRVADMNDASNASIKAWMDQHPQVAAKMTLMEFGTANNMKLGEPNSADRVLTFRNVHNWMSGKNEGKIFKAAFDVLKPGGILGVVEHRAGNKQKEKRGEKGYVSEKAVIAMAKKAGFKLVEKSEINANSKDTKDYADGVWTLPPTLKLGDKDREKYVAIGESDRMTLKFVKPAKK